VAARVLRFSPMFGTLGGPELLLILVIALIVFGPRKLPEIGKSLGKMMVEFRRASNDFKRTIEEEVEADKMRSALEPPRIEPPALPAPEPAPPAGTVAQGDAPVETSSEAAVPSAPAATAAGDETAAPANPWVEAPPTPPTTPGPGEPR
jgi:Tat protein translocase TatB subunit